MSKRSNITILNIILIVGIIFQVVWSLSLIHAKYVSQLEKKEVSLDFLLYYSAGYIVHYDSPTHLYDPQLQHQVQESVIPLGSQKFLFPYNHPPLLAPFLGWVVNTNYSASYLRWVLILVIFQIISLGLLVRLMRILNWERRDTWIIVIAGILFYPALVAFIRGQDSSFLLLGICLWVLGVLTSRDEMAGLGLVLTLLRPQVALVLAIPFIFKKQRVWWWFIGLSFIVFILTYLYIGSTGLIGLARALVFSGQGLGFDVDKMPTLMGLVLRSFPGINPGLLHWIGYSGYVLAIANLSIIWFKSPVIGFKQVNISILAAILFAPHFHGHDLTILLVPAIGVACIFRENRIIEMKYLVLIPMIVSLLLIIGDITSSIIVTYLIIIAFAVFSFRPELFQNKRYAKDEN
jgi:hypothetical protein